MKKGKSLVEFNAKNIFQISQKIQNLLFTVKISFLPSTIQDGMAAHKLEAAQLKYE